MVQIFENVSSKIPKYVADRAKAQEICDKTVEKDSEC